MLEIAKRIYAEYLSRQFLRGVIVEGSSKYDRNSAVCQHCGITVYGYKKAGRRKVRDGFETTINLGQQPDGTWLFETKKEKWTAIKFVCPQCGLTATKVLSMKKPVVTREFITSDVTVSGPR